MATEASLGQDSRGANGVPPRILCIGLTFLPSPSCVPLSSLSFHAIGQKTSSSAASASLESEAARRRFGEGKADGGEGEGGREAAWENSEEETEEEGEQQQKSKFLARQRGERGDVVVLVRWQRRRPKCETEALSDILDCNCRRRRVERGRNTPHYRKYEGRGERREKDDSVATDLVCLLSGE